MTLQHVGDVIAVRTLTLKEPDHPDKLITVLLGRPVAFDGSDDYCVPYQIMGIGASRVKYAAGVDAFQALQLVMRMIATDLDLISRRYDVTISWGAETDLGFPSIA